MKNKLNLNDKIYISGANGMVGSAIVRSLKKYGYNSLLLPKREELDLLDSQKVNKWFKENLPTVVIHAAAKVGGILEIQLNLLIFMKIQYKRT